MINRIWILALSLTMISITTSCDKDPEAPNQEELITTLILRLTDEDGGQKMMLFQDIDGDGGEAPSIVSDALTSNTTYQAEIELLNESEPIVENITTEVQEESDAHQFFFSTTIDDVSVAYLDQDENGNPIGLKTRITTGKSGSGTLTIVLRHEPNKGAQGVDEGDITQAGGETDIEVTFNIDVL